MTSAQAIFRHLCCLGLFTMLSLLHFCPNWISLPPKRYCIPACPISPPQLTHNNYFENKKSVFVDWPSIDWPSSSSKCRTLVKSFISKPVSPLRSSVVEVPSSNIWRQHEFNTALFSARFLSGLGALSPCKIQFKATGSSVRSMLQKQFSFFVGQWMNMRGSSPQQISRGHLRQQLEIQRSEQFKLSA